MTDTNKIPYVFHQTWKSDRLPRDLKRLRQTWLQNHPNAEHRLWTDADNRAFLQEQYAWFVPIYDAYPENIMRVDAVRYFILRHFGGIYADLDFECLKPIDALLEGKQIAIGCEPPRHAREMNLAQKNAGDKILCNAFMASVPNHPFWDYVTQALVEHSKRATTLDVAGPFFLTSAYHSYANKDEISVVSSAQLYPVDKHTITKPRKHWQLGEAFAVHHWRGTWWAAKNSPKAIARRIVIALINLRQAAAPTLKRYLRNLYMLALPGKGDHYRLRWNAMLTARLGSAASDDAHQLWISRLAKGRFVLRALVDLEKAKNIQGEENCPLLSCLMITRERYEQARRAIECFRRQTYPNKELLIVDDDPNDELENWVRTLNDESLVHLRLPDEQKTLGELRNLSVQKARGQYIAQWDDDDLSHPERLLVQMSAMSASGVDVSFLQRQIFWMPDKHKLSVSERRAIENTLVCKKDLLPPYPVQRKSEDTPVCEELTKNTDVILCDRPDLYIYMVHSNNTWGAEHFEKIWQRCSEQYLGDAYNRKLTELEASYGTRLLPSEYFAGRPEALAPKQLPPRDDDEAYPTLLILVPVKNAAAYLPRLFENIANTDYPQAKISLAFLESDSEDGSYEKLNEHLPQLRQKYARAELYKQDFHYRTSRPRWVVSEQYRRRWILARSRNMLLSKALRDEQWVLWIDADVMSWPSNAFCTLLDTGKDIVVPHCVKENGETFDLNTFRLADNAEDLDWDRYIIDGIVQPPVGYGRQYLGEFYGQELVELDAVGGTMLLVRADIHRQGLVFPAYSHRHYIETEGLAQMAIDMGYTCWGMPGLEIVHP